MISFLSVIVVLRRTYLFRLLVQVPDLIQWPWIIHVIWQVWNWPVLTICTTHLSAITYITDVCRKPPQILSLRIRYQLSATQTSWYHSAYRELKHLVGISKAHTPSWIQYILKYQPCMLNIYLMYGLIFCVISEIRYDVSHIISDLYI